MVYLTGKYVLDPDDPSTRLRKDLTLHTVDDYVDLARRNSTHTPKHDITHRGYRAGGRLGLLFLVVDGNEWLFLRPCII